MTVYHLNNWAVNDFQLRHRDLLNVIHAFEDRVRLYGYNQIAHDPAYERLIPAAGKAVSDSVHGHVVIYPDASGVLRYTAVPPEIAQEISKPTYQSPTGNFTDDWLGALNDAAEDFKDMATTVTWIVGGLGFLWLLSNVKSLVGGR